MARPVIDFWYEFASTYSYLAAARIDHAAKAAGVEVRWRPFLVGPLFKNQGLTTSPFNVYPIKGAYMFRDVSRLADDLGLPFAKPDPFPQNAILSARLALVGLDDGWGRDFSRAVYRAEFVEGKNIGEEATLREVLARMNIDADVAIARAQSDPIKARLRENTEEAARLGLFGAPSFTTRDGEIFWGNDRMENAFAWAKRGT